VKDLETKEPIQTDTLMGIGSTTKSMTAVMVASLVDEGMKYGYIPPFWISTNG
jgi:CubicO group peptidase (beta-lactamase class C family)